MTANQTHWQNIQHYIWLIGGLLCMLIAFIFWLVTDTKSLMSENKKIEETQVIIQPEKVAATTNLGGLIEEVRPLQLSTRVVAAGHHLGEFKGTKFFQDNQKKWAVEIFRARNEDVVKSFLNKQVQRNGLIYFRLSGENQVEQYVLAYAPFDSESDAKAQLQMNDLVLPESVKPSVVKLSNYLPFINDLGTDELLGNQKIYQVNLKPAPLPMIDETIIARQKELLAMAQKAITTDTTITRKDEQGNVIDVERSQTTTEAPKPTRPTETQITDPFN